MLLMRVGPIGSETPAVRLAGMPDGWYVDVSDLVGDFDEAFFGGGGIARIEPEVRNRVRGGQVSPIGKQRIGAPIGRPHQIVCIGLNYADHAAETGQDPPAEPIIFSKSPNTLVGPNDDVHIPRGSTKTDWEVELGIVIGTRARYLPDLDAARDAIAGYVCVNDVSEREFQIERGGQWMKGKSAETFNPCGPWLATPDELPAVTSLHLWLTVNGRTRQNGTTGTMLFDPYFLVHYLSQFMVLEPGDLINTGTPPGVGMGQKPPVYLKPGDVMALGIDNLGFQRQQVVAAP